MVDDISKLRPELLQKSPAELRRQRDEIDMALAKLELEAEIAAKQELADRANNHIDAIVAGITFLGEQGILPERVVSAFSRSDGRIIAGTILHHVTPEQLAGVRPARKARDPNAPVRRRRRRNKQTGELE